VVRSSETGLLDQGACSRFPNVGRKVLWWYRELLRKRGVVGSIPRPAQFSFLKLFRGSSFFQEFSGGRMITVYFDIERSVNSRRVRALQKADSLRPHQRLSLGEPAALGVALQLGARPPEDVLRRWGRAGWSSRVVGRSSREDNMGIQGPRSSGWGPVGIAGAGMALGLCILGAARVDLVVVLAEGTSMNLVGALRSLGAP
jgi:hypothetical protein